jgi:hypothetical protein
MWNNRSLIVNRIYLTLLGLSCVVAILGCYLAIRSVYEFAQDRSVLEGELKIQRARIAEIESVSGKDPDRWSEAQLDKGLLALSVENCINALLNKQPDYYDENCPRDAISTLYPKLNNGVYYSGRYNYSQLIFPALLFAPLILLIIGRLWFLWVFVQTTKNS